MMALQILGHIVASVLYVIIFQKAGLRGAWLAVCATPLLSAALAQVMIRGLMGGGMMILPLVLIPLSLAPLLVLAFKSWPPVRVAANTRSEN